jgi:nitrogen fixation/metabolism regulation signal transduction histidine kinase
MDLVELADCKPFLFDRDPTMKRSLYRMTLTLAILLLIVSLYLLAVTTRNTVFFAQLHTALLVLVLVCILFFLILITIHLSLLIQQLRRHTPGARLTARLFGIFTLVAFIPLLVVYSFSIQFISQGIDSWFNLHIGHNLRNALTLSRSTLDRQLRRVLKKSHAVATTLSNTNPAILSLVIYELRSEVGASSMALYSERGRVIAFSTSRMRQLIPHQFHRFFWLPPNFRTSYVGLTHHPHHPFYARAVVLVANPIPWEQPWILEALFPLPQRENLLTIEASRSYARYEELRFLRTPLEMSFIVTLTLVLLLSLLAAASGALYAARRLVAPIQSLIEGFRSVSQGNLQVVLPVTSRDDLGFLSQSFNAMAQQLAEARTAAEQSQSLVEREHSYLRTVLSGLTSGVIALNSELQATIINAAATHVLGIQSHELLGQSMGSFAALHPELSEFAAVCIEGHQARTPDFRREVTVREGSHHRVLLLRAAPLAATFPENAGTVLVFDDLTVQLQAQKDAAWGEVARRLAHEIKNPLTPIQLAAERIQRRSTALLAPTQATELSGLTATIINQVDSLKHMVDAFSEYAKTPELHISRFDLNQTAREVADLYRGQRHPFTLDLHLSTGPLMIEADQARIVQILHNLIKNALEALAAKPGGMILLTTRTAAGGEADEVELSVEDNGPGFTPSILEHAFEPYVTSKRRGTGLGLAIVKKLVEEQGGYIYLANRPQGGALVTLTLPTNESGRGRSLLAQARGLRGRGSS